MIDLEALKSSEIFRTLFILGRNWRKMKHGYAKLGGLTAFIRDCVGDDSLLEISATKILDFNKNDKERLQKSWNRLCKESSNLYEVYKADENEVFNSAKEFFEQVEVKYIFPKAIKKCLFQFCDNFYNEMKKEKLSGLVVELETRNYALFSINQAINLIAIPEYCKEVGLKNVQSKLFAYISKDLSYKSLFDTLLQKTNLPSLTKYIEGLQQTFDNEKEAENEVKKISSFRDTIESAYKKNKNPTWKRFCFILKYCPTELQADFVLAYMLNNIKTSLQVHFDLLDCDFEKIKNDLEIFANTTEDVSVVTKQIAQSYQSYSTLFFGTEKKINEYCKKTLIDFEYKKMELHEYYRSLEELGRIAPNASAFFVPWFKAFVSVAREDYESARDWFKKAFDNYQFAGDYLSRFIKMAFSFENYFVNWEKVRKSISEDEHKSPVNENAKTYWNFGYAIGLFDKKADDTYLEAYKPIRNFYGYFPTECFFDEEKAKERHSKEIMSEMGIHIMSSENKTDFREHDKIPYEVLSVLKTSSQRNKLISFWKVYNDSDENNPKMYTPLALCMQLGSRDERLWDLADTWLDDTENPVDVDKLCFNGSTALGEALTQYKHMRLNSKEVSEKQKKLRAVTSKLIDRTTYLGETKFQKQVHTLQEAIDGYDVDFVKRIADKISDEDFQTYRISADEQSPLYYVLSRRYPLLKGLERMKMIENMPQNKDNCIWKNLAVPGFTEEEKRAYKQEYQSGSSDFAKGFQMMKDEFTPLCYGLATKELQLPAFDEIIDYFISRTKDVDSFTSKKGITPLYYAAEMDDVKTCRKLLQRGATITKVNELVPNLGDAKGNIVKMPDTFIFRCLNYESWNTLKMFLTEFKEKAETVMHRGNFEVTPLVVFIISQRQKISIASFDERFQIANRLAEFTELFLSCGASMTESTELGCAEYNLRM